MFLTQKLIINNSLILLNNFVGFGVKHNQFLLFYRYNCQNCINKFNCYNIIHVHKCIGCLYKNTSFNVTIIYHNFIRNVLKHVFFYYTLMFRYRIQYPAYSCLYSGYRQCTLFIKFVITFLLSFLLCWLMPRLIFCFSSSSFSYMSICAFIKSPS